MLDISWTEFLVIAVVALIVIGPKDLPRALRTLGNWTAKVKSMAREFQHQLDEAVREAELDSIKTEIENLASPDPGTGIKEPTSSELEICNGAGTPMAAEAQEAEPLAQPQPPSLSAGAAIAYVIIQPVDEKPMRANGDFNLLLRESKVICCKDV